MIKNKSLSGPRLGIILILDRYTFSGKIKNIHPCPFHTFDHSSGLFPELTTSWVCFCDPCVESVWGPWHETCMGSWSPHPRQSGVLCGWSLRLRTSLISGIHVSAPVVLGYVNVAVSLPFPFAFLLIPSSDHQGCIFFWSIWFFPPPAPFELWFSSPEQKLPKISNFFSKGKGRGKGR